MTSQLKEQSNRLEAERKKCDDLSGDLRRTQVERESFERQVIGAVHQVVTYFNDGLHFLPSAVGWNHLSRL